MRELYRIIDANLNRAREGLRVLEEICRFILDDPDMTSKLKELRHELGKLASVLPGGTLELVRCRDVAADVGAGSWTEGERSRSSIIDLAAANFKRVQEASRVLEEFGKLLGPSAEGFKRLRYETYIMEQEMLGKIKTQKRP